MMHGTMNLKFFVLCSNTCFMLNSFFSLILYYTEYVLCCILC